MPVFLIPLGLALSAAGGLAYALTHKKEEPKPPAISPNVPTPTFTQPAKQLPIQSLPTSAPISMMSDQPIERSGLGGAFANLASSAQAQVDRSSTLHGEWAFGDEYGADAFGDEWGC